MTGEETDKPAFQIGLAMAGAVSAGAYSAGVFDFLMEALNEWQKAKDRGENVPRHDVFISALSGSSAGGITAALGLASLAGGVRSVEERAANPNQSWPVKRVLPELYDLWVKKLRLFGTREEPAKGVTATRSQALLSPEDIKHNMPHSFLNSEVLTTIARESVSSIRPTGELFGFFADKTHLFLTHTNLDGIPYPISFEGDEYSLMLHEDRVHFDVRGLGKRKIPPSGWLDKWDDPGDEIDLGKLGKLAGAPVDRALEQPFEDLAQAALTTSAFPFGFSARQVSVKSANLHRRAMPFEAPGFPEALKEQSKKSKSPIERAHFVSIDGGALNNEPFELVRWTIRSLDQPQNSRDKRSANRAVILIAPFPPESTLDHDRVGKAARELGMDFVGKALVPALMNQAKFRASDLIAASDPDVYSRYLISPKRLADKKKPALACAALKHFGGFLDEQFREHDFQLGRRNCQRFLENHFVLHPSNRVFGSEADVDAPDDANLRPIIPLVGTAAVSLAALPPWPAMPRHKLVDLRAALQHRLDPFVAVFTAQALKSYPGLRFVTRLWWWRRRREIVGKLMRTIEDELVSAEQLAPAPPPTFWARWRAWVLGLIALALVAAVIALI